MKKISIAILALITVLAACKKVPEVNLEYVDVERDLITVGMTTATVQCDYQYIATLKKAYLYYGEGVEEADMNAAEMRVVQNTLYVDLAGLKANTTYSYYYEFHNGFNSMRTAVKTFKTEASPTTVTLPIVVTATVTEITTNSAKGGGEVTNDGGAAVTERGICWSTNTNPTLNDNHVAAGEGTGAFTAMMNGLEDGTTYHIRAYATNEAGTAYGLDREFVTDGGCDFDYVDLGLPSGTLWATCNVGANSPEEYGDYFAWGETEPKSYYEWSTYKHCNGDASSLTKYCTQDYYGYNGFVDNLITLQSIDDAASLNWCDDWCMPSEDQWKELKDNTEFSWSTQNGVGGCLFTASNGNSIFLPAAGSYWGDEFYQPEFGRYLSSSVDLRDPANVKCFGFSSSYCQAFMGSRSNGQSVRPVRKNDTPIPPNYAPEGAINGLFTINANGDQVYFSKGNLQYQASTNTWKFAENQWDFIGEANSSIAETNGNWIDLFGWGTSGYNHGAVCYQPWSISTDNNDYYAYGNWLEDLRDLTGTADWGYNPINNGGNIENCGWMTPTNVEFEYLLYSRNTESGFRFTKAIVNNIKGVILFPDDWSVSYYLLTDINDGEVYFGNNVINEISWTYLEAHGAVFLPASGCRNSATILNIDNGGYYWLASHGSEELSVSFAFWDNPPFFACGSSNRREGRSVRLFQRANL